MISGFTIRVQAAVHPGASATGTRHETNNLMSVCPNMKSCLIVSQGKMVMKKIVRPQSALRNNFLWLIKYELV
jgi:hypothetical protein